jgi:proliferating cell nuclear antigen
MVKFECKIAGFRNLIDAISQIVSDVVFVFTKKGIKLQCMDTSHVGLIMLSLPRSTFIRYTFTAGENTTEEKVGMNLVSFLKILKCAQAKDTCIISTSSDNNDHLNIEFTNSSHAFEYEMKLLDLPYSPIDIPERDDDATIVFPSSDFQTLIKDLSPLGAEVYISANDQNISFTIESDTGKGMYTIEYKDPSTNEAGVICTEYEETVKQLFSLKYLSNFSKACSFCEKVELRMKDEYPLVMRFPLPRMSDCLITDDDGTQQQNYGILLFFLAPKIEE